MKCQPVRVIIGYEVSQYSTVAVCYGESRWEYRRYYEGDEGVDL